MKKQNKPSVPYEEIKERMSEDVIKLLGEFEEGIDELGYDFDAEEEDEKYEEEKQQIPVGWVCPRCLRVYSPYIPMCECNGEMMIKARYERRKFL